MSRRSHLTKRQEWKKRLARYAKSDQTVAQFCLDEGVSAPSLYYWRKTLLPEPTETAAAAPTRFQPVQIVPPVATPSGQATIIRWGCKLEIQLGSDLAIVEAVIRQLLDAAGVPHCDGSESC
jgi:hypothetical protein